MSVVPPGVFVGACPPFRPDTLRAKFGLDIVRNGIHCTDLVEDGPLESDFMFVAMAEGV